MVSFANSLIRWQRLHGRHDLPWSMTRDPYRIWLSEVMLQQTQVATVRPYYERFLAEFPEVGALAAADEDRVMRLWSGLGYYSRARNLHRCAQHVVAAHGGRFPASAEQLEHLPGIGRSTAAAIAVFAHGQRAAILDGNVKRVLSRHFLVEGDPALAATVNRLWAIAERELPAADIEIYTQALMDLGATLCVRRRPECGRCPVQATCAALAAGAQDQLPTRRVRKPAPLRHTRLLVLRRGDEVLLERRPAPGIWGGLWSLPEIDSHAGPGVPELAAPLAAAARRFGVSIDRIVALAPIDHAFTHFRLRIEPWLADVCAAGVAEPGPLLWLPVADAADAALPRPIKTLLCALADDPASLMAVR